MPYKNKGDAKKCRKRNYKRNYNKNKEICRNKYIKKQYGITIEEYDEMFQNQNGLCGICGKPETHKHNRSGVLYRLAIDHNHITGTVRGLLCQKCNTALGYLDEDIDKMLRMIEYIRKQ